MDIEKMRFAGDVVLIAMHEHQWYEKINIVIIKISKLYSLNDLLLSGYSVARLFFFT